MKIYYTLLLTCLLITTNAISQTFTSNQVYDIAVGCSDDLDIIIDLSAEDIPNLDGNLFGLSEVCIDIEHTWISDIDVLLKNPMGMTIELTSDNGLFGDDYQNTCFKMNGNDGLVIFGAAPFAGSYIPEGDLNAFNNNTNPNSIWELIVCDDQLGFSGTINSWSLTFGAPIPTECSVIDSTILVDFLINSEGDGWTENYGWITGDDVPYSEWYGVEVDQDGCVTELNLSDNNINGFIYPNLNGLSKLNKLDLSNNGLGSFPPSSLGYISTLDYLDLSNNENLDGEYPDSYISLCNISYTNFDGTELPDFDEFCPIIYDYQVMGQVVFDSNLSCDADDGEQGLSSFFVQLEGVQTQMTETNNSGYFSVGTDEESVVLKVIPPNDLWEPCPDEIQLEFNTINDTINIDYPIVAVDDCPAIELDISAPTLRRCFENTYYVTVKNTGTILAEDVQVAIQLDSFFTLIDVSIPDYTSTDNNLNVSIGDLDVFETFSFTFIVEVSCDIEIGEIHCVSISSEFQNDCDIDYPLAIAFESQEECQPNTGAYDPNDKRAFSDGTLTDQYTLKDSLIEYQIRFQNTGTDTAFNIVVIDTLSPFLDVSTFRLGISSHPVSIDIDDDRIVKFNYNNIMLPDSNINEPASNGFVKFKIRTIPTFDIGDILPNQAAIYFDFNEPIFTNLLELEIAPPLSTNVLPLAEQKYLSIFPQPASSVVNFTFLDNQLTNFENYKLEVFNAKGVVVEIKEIDSNTFQIRGLESGMYFYRLSNANVAQEVGKFVVINNE